MSLLIVDHQKEICFITINRTKDRNSINTPLMKELEEVLTETEKTAARAVVFQGAGDSHFIGGADGVEMMQLDPEGASAFSSPDPETLHSDGGKSAYPGGGH